MRSRVQFDEGGPMKVVLHGFGTFPVLYRHLIVEARAIAVKSSRMSVEEKRL